MATITGNAYKKVLLYGQKIGQILRSAQGKMCN